MGTTLKVFSLFIVHFSLFEMIHGVALFICNNNFLSKYFLRHDFRNYLPVVYNFDVFFKVSETKVISEINAHTNSLLYTRIHLTTPLARL